MRTRIALRNLYISQAVIILFLIFAYLVWFPFSFTTLGGFTNTAFMLILVDLVLGPLLVFIVYKEDKKHLSFDINVLLAIQLLAFFYGAYSLYLKHPAYAVFSVDRFTLTNVSALYPKPSISEQLQKQLVGFPKIVVAKLPEDQQQKNQLFLEVLFQKLPYIDQRPQFFKPLELHAQDVLSKTLSPNMLFFNNERQQKLHTFLETHGGKARDYAYFPLSGNNKKDVVLVFNKNDAKPVGIIDIDPWIRVSQLKK